MYEELFIKLEEAGNIRNLTQGSITCYKNCITIFLNFIQKEPETLTCNDVRTFLLAKKAEGLKAKTSNLYNTAIHFLFKYVLCIPWDDALVPRMLIDRKLPVVLERNEVNLILDVTTNLKHKAMIAVMYSAGLRVSEVCLLHYKDISRKNMQIHVRKSKNRQDRYSILSKRCLDILTEYWFKCGRPTDILFPSDTTGSYITTNSFRNVVVSSAEKAGITRRITPHCLRHSFATHLLEQGADIRLIQALLGHRNPNSTEIYLHVSNKSLMNIQSPFDLSDQEELHG